MQSIMFQSTSSEEDVVSNCASTPPYVFIGFNPRPPKRTLCREADGFQWDGTKRFNPRPPKRTLCPDEDIVISSAYVFQSTSSEEDVVSRFFGFC